MLFVVGTILFVLHGFTGKTLVLHMVRLFVLTALLVMLPQWGNQVQQLVQSSILIGERRLLACTRRQLADENLVPAGCRNSQASCLRYPCRCRNESTRI